MVLVKRIILNKIAKEPTTERILYLEIMLSSRVQFQPRSFK